MPKFARKRARSEEEENDFSDAEVETKQRAKKAKATQASSKAKSAAAGEEGKDAEGNPYWHLSNMRRVGISKFKGAVLVNIREYYEQNGEVKPGKKGISLSVDQYKALLKSIPAINAELRKEGVALEPPAAGEDDEDRDDDGSGDDDEESDRPSSKPAAKKPAKKDRKKLVAAKKLNIEATSEESD